MVDLKGELEDSSSKTSEEEDKWPADPNGPIQASKFLKDGYEEAGPNSALGLNVPRVSGLAHATGQAEFIEDMPVATNELFMALVCSTEAHARIVSVDESAALALPGVKKFMSAKDIPEGANKFKILGLVDEDIFADEEVLFEGHPIGAILANTEKLARHAASLVEVTYKTLKPVVSIDDAISANSFFDVSIFHKFLLFRNFSQYLSRWVLVSQLNGTKVMQKPHWLPASPSSRAALTQQGRSTSTRRPTWCSLSRLPMQTTSSRSMRARPM